MSTLDADYHQLFQSKKKVNLDALRTALLANPLTPTNDQIRDWLQSPQIKQWLTKLTMGIPNTLKMEIINTLVKNIADNPDKDCRVEYGGAAIGVDVSRWQLWASYRLPYASGIKAPNCPYTLKKHLEK